MKTAIIHEHGGLEAIQFEDRPTPEPACDQVRIDVRAVALNHLDLWARKGVPGFPFPLPMVPGCDATGVVSAVGSQVQGVSLGDRVVVAPGTSCGQCESCHKGNDHHCRKYGIFGEHHDGLLAEQVLVPRENVLAMPDRLSYEEAACIGIPFLTAWHMVVNRAALRPGETVLIQAAGSGVSVAAIQVARMVGATIIATAGSDAKLAKARELGADHTIDYKVEDVASRVKEITGKRGVEVVIDHVGSDTWAGSMRSLAWQGRFVTCGATSGIDVQLNLRHLFFKEQSVLGSTMGSRGELIEILRHVGDGKLLPVIGATLPWTDVAEGHRMLEERSVFGKVVLTVSSD